MKFYWEICPNKKLCCWIYITKAWNWQLWFVSINVSTYV